MPKTLAKREGLRKICYLIWSRAEDLSRPRKQAKPQANCLDVKKIFTPYQKNIQR
jgi:hypothetical protein